MFPFRFLLVLLAASLTGCSPSQPATEAGRQFILDQITQDSEGRISLLSFQKTNGQQAQVRGVAVYSLEFQARIEFTEDCKWVETGVMRGRSFKTRMVPPNRGTTRNFLEQLEHPGELVRRGHQETLAGIVLFEKTEQGWRAKHFEIK